MVVAKQEFHPRDHGEIEKLNENLWRVQGPVPDSLFSRVMTVVRLADERLVIHNGIAMNPESMAELEAWGRPTFLIVPGGYHRLDARAYAARYPELTVIAPAGSAKRVGKLVEVNGDYDSFADQPEIQLAHLEGTANREGAMIVRSEDGATIVFNDIVFNMPHQNGVGGFVLRFVTASSGGPKIPRVARIFFIKDAAALSVHLRRLADTPELKRIIVSHHEMITDDVRGILREVAATL